MNQADIVPTLFDSRLSRSSCRRQRFLQRSGLTGLFALLGLWSGAAHAATFTIPDGDVAALKSALATANTNDEADTINLAADGTYILTTPDNNTNGKNALPVIANDLFATGTELTLNGDGARIKRSSAGATPDFRILQISYGATVSITGLTIANGQASGIFPANAGGGVYNDHGMLSLSNCTLNGNSANSDGGGIYNYGANGNATLSLSNCTLNRNSAGYGGGIYNDGDSGNAALSLSNCNLKGNSATYGGGGGICNNGRPGNATLNLSHCTLNANSANYGGGIYSFSFGGNATLSLSNCTLNGNSANSNDGGGIYNDGHDGSAALNLSNCTLNGNSANSEGGGIYNYIEDSVLMSVTNCTLNANSANYGGGIYNTAQLGSTVLRVSNCTLSGNSAAKGGGGIYNNGHDK